MQVFGTDQVVFSASDLSNANDCLWAQVRRIDKALGFDITVPKENDEMLKRAGKLGDVHEQKKLAELKIKYEGSVVEIPRPDDSDKKRTQREKMVELNKQTIEALKSGVAVVFQATFFDEEFQGFADFLIRNEQGQYEVFDTKLARRAKITALLQLAAYADQLQKLGIPVGQKVHLILGDQSVSTHNLEDILPTFLHQREMMSNLIDLRRKNKSDGGEALSWYDNSYKPCGRCAVCEPNLEIHDDLFALAGIRAEQRLKLIAADIPTLTALSQSQETRIPGMAAATFNSLKNQARLQVSSRANAAETPPEFELADPQALSALPTPSDGDIFFDFEGDPLYQEGNFWNLDYLFGFVDKHKKFTSFWAHNLQQERKALIDFLDEVRRRLALDPKLHIYHYAAYEKTHLLSLAARHGIGEDFVDELLENNVLVDLYPIVKRGLIVGSPSYSLKKLEPLYMGDEERDGVANAADSVKEYAEYCELVAEHHLDEAKIKLQAIADYNEYDCRSTLALRNWLAELAADRQIPLLGDITKDSDLEVVPEPDPLYSQLMGLIEGVTLTERDADQTAIALTAAAIDFHRREKKKSNWEYYNRLETPIEDWPSYKDVFIINSTSVERDWAVEGGATSLTRLIRVSTTPTPGSKIDTGRAVGLVYPNNVENLPEPPSPGAYRPASAKVYEVLSETDFILIETKKPDLALHYGEPLAITPGFGVPTDTLAKAIHAWGSEVYESYPKLERDPGLDILRRVTPETKIELTEKSYETHLSIEKSLTSISVGSIAVQGPPGAGKSFNGGQVIADLVIKHGWKIGVVGQSHATVENLLRSVAGAGLPKESIGKAVKTGETVSSMKEDSTVTWTPFGAKGYEGFFSDQEGYVVGGTAWDFVNQSRIAPKQLDLLVIDEAGQFSLANTVAVSVSTNRLLLLGDPQQLPQVTVGTHPEPIDGSALGWIVGSQEVIPPEFGFFLDRSFRMGDELCATVSDNWYQGKLSSKAPARNLEGTQPGFHPMPITHLGNSTESHEEAERVVALVKDVITKSWTEKSITKPLSEVEQNVIVVAPYNAQVQMIRKKLDQAGLKNIPVGTVDKFQGQEAAIAIVSLTASSADEIPRGIEFLLMPNRLNVAISRAKWAAYLIYSPGLLNYKPTNIENLRLLSRFIKLVGR
jgi:uncharacterized protein